MPIVRTTMAAVKAKLKRMIGNRLGSVQVVYGDAGQFARREGIRLGVVDIGDQERVSMRSGKGRQRETYILHILVESWRNTPEAAEARVAELAGEIEDMLASNPKLDNTDNVLWAIVDGMEMETDETDEGSRAVIDIRVQVVADLART